MFVVVGAVGVGAVGVVIVLLVLCTDGAGAYRGEYTAGWGLRPLENSSVTILLMDGLTISLVSAILLFFFLLSLF